MSQSSAKATTTEVFDYINALLKPHSQKIDEPNEDFLIPASDNDNNSGLQTASSIEYLLAAVGRFQILIAKKNIRRLLKFNRHMLSQDLNGSDLFEILSHLQAREWRGFSSIDKGYIIEFNPLLKAGQYLYLDHVKGISAVASNSLQSTRLSEKWPWVNAVAAKPLRLTIDVEKLQLAWSNEGFQSIKINQLHA